MENLQEIAKYPAKKAFSLLEEFKSFAFKSSLIDLTLGVILGASFSQIINSLVKNIIMPCIGIIIPGNQEYLKWEWVIGGQKIAYGIFLGDVINFLLISFALFIFVVKFLKWITRIKQETGTAPITSAPIVSTVANANMENAIAKQLELLTEIRDLLKEAKQTKVDSQ